MAGFMFGGGGGGGGIATVAGTTDQITANTVGSAVTLSMPTNVIISGTSTAGNLETNGSEILRGFGLGTAAEKNRNFVIRRHIKISSTATGWQDIISWRPYLAGTTTVPSDYWGTTIYTIQLAGHCAGVGNGARYARTAVFLEGSGGAGGISGAADLRHHTVGTVTDFQVHNVGWVSTLQYRLTGSQTGLHGFAQVEISLGVGAGSQGAGIEWVVS